MERFDIHRISCVIGVKGWVVFRIHLANAEWLWASPNVTDWYRNVAQPICEFWVGFGDSYPEVSLLQSDTGELLLVEIGVFNVGRPYQWSACWPSRSKSFPRLF